jgi:hypothetical protein
MDSSWPGLTRLSSLLITWTLSTTRGNRPRQVDAKVHVAVYSNLKVKEHHTEEGQSRGVGDDRDVFKQMILILQPLTVNLLLFCQEKLFNHKSSRSDAEIFTALSGRYHDINSVSYTSAY